MNKKIIPSFRMRCIYMGSKKVGFAGWRVEYSVGIDRLRDGKKTANKEWGLEKKLRMKSRGWKKTVRCKFSGALPLIKTDLIDSLMSSPVMLLNSKTQANSEKTSMMVSRYLKPLFSRAYSSISTRSVCQVSSMPLISNFRRG